MMLLTAMLVNQPALVCCLMLLAPSAARQDDPAPSTGIDLRIDPLADLIGFARHLAERPANDDPPQLATAVDAVRNLNRGFGRSGFLAFGIIDCQLLPGDGVAAFAARLAQLPEEISLPGGAKAPVRVEAVRFGVALVQAEPWFLEEVWPDHRAELERTRARIDAAFVPHETACFDYMLQSLGIADPHVDIPLFLVRHAAWPGAYTYSDREDGAFCVVASDEQPDTRLFETMLHESTHALDVLADHRSGDAVDASVFARLRAGLEARALSAADRRFRDVPHTLMFVQAGETIRRLVDPDHVHYGDAAAYYPKVEPIAKVEREEWGRFLDGEISRDEALRRILDRLVPAEDG